MTTRLPKESVTISDEELRSLTDAIRQRHGIDFSCYEPKSLKRRIGRALHIFKLSGIHELWTIILSDHSFIYPLMDEISVGLTAMFRDPVLWRRLHLMLKNDEVFKNKEELSIWHAGCSTGEEVYSMGIVLSESFFSKPVKAWATDISNQAISLAKKGVYTSSKMAEYEQNYKQFNPAASLKNYYTENGGMCSMRPGLIDHVTFEYHNLIRDPFEHKFDVVFCRNVMIYFDERAKQMLFDKFYEALNPNGLFVIGFYDALLPLIDATKFEIFDMDAKIFRKK